MKNQKSTLGQELLKNLDVNALIDYQLSVIAASGFVPAGLWIGRTLYEKYKESFCSEHGIDVEDVEVKRIKGLKIFVSNDRDFRFNGGSNSLSFTLPLQIVYELPDVTGSEATDNTEISEKESKKLLNHGQE